MQVSIVFSSACIMSA